MIRRKSIEIIVKEIVLSTSSNLSKDKALKSLSIFGYGGIIL